MSAEQAKVAGKKSTKSDNINKSTKKRRNYKKELEEVKKELETLKDQHLRIRAEFDNYRKRRDKEIAAFLENANSGLIESLLPVLDDFERSFEIKMDDDDRDNPFYQGIEMIYQKIKSILDKEGVTPIEAIGKEFDPEMHEALMQMESKEHPPNTVINEIVKGYKLRDKVLRYAKVVVSKQGTE